MIARQPVFERWLMDGAVLIDPVAQPGVLRLDGTAASLWRVLAGADGDISEAELVTALAAEYHTAAAHIADDVRVAVDSLVEHGAASRHG